jgi:hypothetical protein
METQDENTLGKYFDSIKNENNKESFTEFENWLRREAVFSETVRPKSKFTFLKYVFSEGRLKFAYLFVILIFAGITSNFSVTRTETVGNIMSWTVDKQKQDVIKKIDNLDWIDKSQLVVDVSNNDGTDVLTYKMIVQNSTKEEIEKYKNELENISDVHSIKIIPISEPVKQPLYAVALEKVFQYDYNKNSVNPDDIRNNVFEQLKIAGLGNFIDLNIPPNSGAGKFININFEVPDSVRIKIHDDIVNEYDLERALDEFDDIIAPMKVINDSVIKKIIIRINGENMNPSAILYEVHRNLDTLHLRLKNSDINRKEKIERFNEKMEKFNKGMEKFNEKMKFYSQMMTEYGNEMSKYGEEMSKYGDRMSNLGEEMEEYKESIDELKNLPKLNFNFEIPEVPEPPDVDIEVPEAPEVPDVEDVPDIDDNSFNFNFNFNTDEFQKNLQLKIDSIKINIDPVKMERMGKKMEEKMKRMEERLKKSQDKMKHGNYSIDSSNVKINIEDEDDNDEKNDENNE